MFSLCDLSIKMTLGNYLCSISEWNSGVTLIAWKFICGREERRGQDVVPEASSIRISQTTSTPHVKQSFRFFCFFFFCWPEPFFSISVMKSPTVAKKSFKSPDFYSIWLFDNKGLNSISHEYNTGERHLRKSEKALNSWEDQFLKFQQKCPARRIANKLGCSYFLLI